MRSFWKGILWSGSLLGAIACDPELRGGVCVHEYRDPLIVIKQVVDGVTGRPVPTVALTSFVLNGQPLAVTQVLPAARDRNVLVRGDTLWCEVQCGFSSSEGSWVFTISAPGYSPLGYHQDIRYRVFKGGCPSYNAGSTELAFRLASVPPT